ncbi:MAG: diguanylate cyclase [Spirochaetaceae bacterium]|jgi:diguanylate cyclase (GGDEF)-like protein|nr:diguanylate cyclase [Spirochaetaceae bacterium]
MDKITTLEVKEESAKIRELEKQIYDLKELFEISKCLNSTLDYAVLIDSILLTCMAQLKVIRVGLFIRKHLDSEEFSLHRNYTGFDVDHAKVYAIPNNHPMIQLFAREYECYTLQDLKKKNIPFEGLENIISLEPSLLVPLHSQGKINGVIMLGGRIDTDGFDDYEKEYLLNVAAIASIAINNASLFEMTTTDMMTKLKLKHYLYAVLNEWLAAAKHGSGFSLLMFDVDFFKKINDTYGHTVGDVVLKYVARIIMDSIRNTDVAVRYGGEEFVVLVSRPGKTLAMKIAERIRKSIENSKIKYKDIVIKTTISGGVVCYDPVVDISDDVMIERADKSLYQSKQNGRNRITLSVPAIKPQNDAKVPVLYSIREGA